MEAYKYQSINEVPASWRSHKSARLSLAQINEIMADAHANPITTKTRIDNEDGTEEVIASETPDYGGARRRFAESHHIENSFWLAGAKVEEAVEEQEPAQ